MSFDARYTGLPGAKFKVKGIGLSKNKTWVGAGALTEVNKSFGWYVNYDGSIDSGKGKGSNNVYTTGVRINFWYVKLKKIIVRSEGFLLKI